MSTKNSTLTTGTILDLVQSEYMDLDESGVYFESAEGGYQDADTGAVSSDDLVDDLLDGAESEERDEMIAILDRESMNWIKR